MTTRYYISVKKAAALCGYNERYICHLLKHGKINWHKEKGCWLVDEQSFKIYMIFNVLPEQKELNFL
jgi:hypothetical protein